MAVLNGVCMLTFNFVDICGCNFDFDLQLDDMWTNNFDSNLQLYQDAHEQLFKQLNFEQLSLF